MVNSQRTINSRTRLRLAMATLALTLAGCSTQRQIESTPGVSSQQIQPEVKYITKYRNVTPKHCHTIKGGWGYAGKRLCHNHPIGHKHSQPKKAVKKSRGVTHLHKGRRHTHPYNNPRHTHKKQCTPCVSRYRT